MLHVTPLRRWLVLGLLAMLTDSGLLAEETAVGRFAKPPSESRILKIIHNWPDDPAAQDALIGQLSRQGFGGVVCNVSFDEYLQSEPRWRAFDRAVRKAKDAGWTMWLYDERGYPSGNAGGLVLRDHPEWEAQGVLVADATTSGEAVDLIVPPGRRILAAAFPLAGDSIDTGGKLDLSGQVREGHLRWTPPPGRWAVLVLTVSRLYEGTHAEGNLAEKMPYINLLQAEPTRRFLELTHQRYADRLGPDLSRWFVSTFTDEPSLMSLFLRRMPYRVLPWSPGLAESFRSRRGYDLEPTLPELVLDAGDPGKKHRHDFWLTVGELVSENYFGHIQTWCREHHLASGGHLLMEESLAAHVPLYGDFFRCARRLDAPSIDCLSSLPPEVPWYVARLVASAAELEGKRLVMSETSDHAQRYRPAGDRRPVRDVSEAEIRGTCNRLMVGGVNCITSYYSFAGLDDAAIRRLNEQVGRCCELLRGGHQAADIAVVYPIETAWTTFVPSHEWTRDAHATRRVESVFRATLDNLFRDRREFTIVDSRAIAESLVKGNALEHGALRWSVVILPSVDTLSLAAWEKLARFVQAGGVLVAIGGLPRNSEAEFPSARVQAIGRVVFGEGSLRTRAVANAAGGGGIVLPAGSEGLLPTVLRGVLEPALTVDPSDAPLRLTRRRVDGRELWFLINDSPTPWRGRVGIASAGRGQLWDPGTGAISECPSSDRLELSLDAYGSIILRWDRPATVRRLALTSGDLPSLAERPLPLGDPHLAHGEFVRAQLGDRKGEPGPGRPRLSADATLTRGRVDTHLFVRFPRQAPFRLQAGDCLVIDSRVPEGQKAATNLLVILHEEDGGDFLATTTRSLAQAGQERTFVPLDQFEHAGWSRDADGALDLGRITDVSVGWGGYFGAEGERVQFEVAPPRVGSTERPRPGDEAR